MYTSPQIFSLVAAGLLLFILARLGHYFRNKNFLDDLERTMRKIRSNFKAGVATDRVALREAGRRFFGLDCSAAKDLTAVSVWVIDQDGEEYNVVTIVAAEGDV